MEHIIHLPQFADPNPSLLRMLLELASAVVVWGSLLFGLFISFSPLLGKAVGFFRR